MAFQISWFQAQQVDNLVIAAETVQARSAAALAGDDREGYFAAEQRLREIGSLLKTTQATPTINSPELFEAAHRLDQARTAYDESYGPEGFGQAESDAVDQAAITLFSRRFAAVRGR